MKLPQEPDTNAGMEIPSLAALSQEPDWIEKSAWTEHVPLVFLLVPMLRPRVFVELGVHRGMSFFAFCQAARSTGIATRCVGVDTWKGDPHAGAYGDEVYKSVSGHQQERYADCSSLMRMSFDEACGRIEDKSVDLLHIDGWHTYDAVKHDYETWLPKLSGRGVVLFHDISVKRDDFGVWKFWEEISRTAPAASLDYAAGLGILAAGGEPDADCLRMLSLLRDNAGFRMLMEVLGKNLRETVLLRNTLDRIGAADAKDNVERIERLSSELDRTLGIVGEMQGSRSWRMTALLRNASGLLRSRGRGRR